MNAVENTAMDGLADGTVSIEQFPPPIFGKLQTLLGLLEKLRGASDLTTPDGLHGAIELVIELAQFAGVDQAWIDRVTGLLNDSTGFNLALAIARYVESILSPTAPVSGPPAASPAPPVGVNALLASTTIDAKSLTDWLPIVLQIIRLIQQLRGVK